jgi:hypothetical protein
LSPDAADDSLGEGASDDENSRTYYFGPLSITVGKIKEMVEKGYFMEGKGRAPRAETVPEPDKTTTKPLCMKTFLLLACACLRTPL